MKIAFVNTWGGGAIYNVLRPVYEALKQEGWEVEWKQLRGGDRLEHYNYDIIHFNYFANMLPQLSNVTDITCSVHHMHPQHVPKYMQHINQCGPARIHTADPFCMRQLQQHYYADVTVIPYTFDWKGFDITPLPPKFKVGFLGCDYNTKRFDSIVEACKVAQVEYASIARKTLNEEKDFVPQQDILDFYRSISCFVVASYNDGGPLPPQEALLMGRPVATTHVGMMPLVIKEGINGTFHNGSVEDMARAILRVRDRAEEMHGDISMLRRTGRLLPTIDDVLPKWKEFFEGVVG